MLKKITLLLLLCFFWSCGYEPLYLKKNDLKQQINVITLNGDQKINKMIIVNVNYILTVVIILFLIGLLGLILNRKNILITIMSVELMLLAVNLNFITFSIYLDDITGYVFVLFILTIAATESAIGLAILSIYYKLKQTIQMDKIKN